MFRWESDDEASAMAAFTREDPTDRESFDRHYARILADDSVLLRVIEADGTAVGTISSFDDDGGRELTYWVDRARWGRGIATDGVRAFLELERRRPLLARVAAHNLGSRAVLERTGFRHVGEERSWSSRLSTTVEERIYRLD